LIFVTVGNWHKGFDRLVEAVDKLKEQRCITEEVIAQVGSGVYKPANLKVFDYCPPDAFERFLKNSRIVITHAGIGTVYQAINISKPVIVVPRKAARGEHFDDHQEATAEALEKEGKVLVAHEVSDLPEKLKEAETFVPSKCKSNPELMKTVENFLQKLQAEKGLKK